MPDDDVDAVKARVNELVAYHSPISEALTNERTSLESKLIPVTAYIVIACAEAYLRYPAMARLGSARRCRPARSSRRARVPGCQVDTCFLWSIANFALLGRKIYAQMDPTHDSPPPAPPDPGAVGRGGRAYRGDDGTRQAWDTGSATPVRRRHHRGAARRYPGDRRGRRAPPHLPVQRHPRQLPVPALLRHEGRLRRHRPLRGPRPPRPHPAGAGLLPARRQRLLVERRLRRHPVHQPDRRLRARGRVVHHHRLRHVEPHARGLPRPARRLRPVHHRRLRPGVAATRCPRTEIDGIVAAVRKAQSAHYRNIAAMDRMEKIRCGAYVYFTFLRPFAELAGVADELDWTVPWTCPTSSSSSSPPWRATTARRPTRRDYYEAYAVTDELPASPSRSTPADEGRHAPGTGAAVERVVVLRLLRRRRLHRRLDPPRAVPQLGPRAGTTPWSAAPTAPPSR